MSDRGITPRGVAPVFVEALRVGPPKGSCPSGYTGPEVVDINPPPGTVRVEMKDGSGKEVEKTFQLGVVLTTKRRFGPGAGTTCLSRPADEVLRSPGGLVPTTD